MARIKRRTIQIDIHDPDNHNGVITHLEPHPGVQSQVGLKDPLPMQEKTLHMDITG